MKKEYIESFAVVAKEFTPNLELLFNPKTVRVFKTDEENSVYVVTPKMRRNWLQIILAMRTLLDDKNMQNDFVGNHEVNCKNILERLAVQFGQQFDPLDNIFDKIDLFDFPNAVELEGFAHLLDDGHGLKSISY